MFALSPATVAVLIWLLWPLAKLACIRFEGHLAAILDFLLCRGWGYDPTAESGMREAATLTALGGAQIVAIGAYGLQDRKATAGVVILYIVGALTPLVGLAFLRWHHKYMSTSQIRVHRYPLTTVRYSTFVGGWLLVGFVTSGVVYFKEALAGHPTYSVLHPSTAYSHEFKRTAGEVTKGERGIAVVYEFTPKDAHLPFEVNLLLDQKLFAGWHVVSVLGQAMDATPSDGDLPPFFVEPIEANGPTRIFWHRISANRKYQLTILLRGPDGKAPTEELLSIIKDGARSPATYLTSK